MHTIEVRWLCWRDQLSNVMSLVQRLQGHGGPVVCVAAASDGQAVLSGDEAGTLCCYEAGTLQLQFHAQLGTPDDAVTSVCTGSEPSIVFASMGTSVHTIDLRSGTAPVATFQDVCKDEINQVAVNMKATHLATADDAGDVKVFDLTARNLFKCMRGAHGSMATGVCFRPHRPWELISGGMDSTVARWDFSKGKCLSRWQMAQPTGHEERQVFNPPFVHALAVPAVPSSTRPWCQLAAAARGDGTVMVFDADQSPAATAAALIQQHGDGIQASNPGSMAAGNGSVDDAATLESTAAGSTSLRGGTGVTARKAGHSKQKASDSKQQQLSSRAGISGKAGMQKQPYIGKGGWRGPTAWGAEHSGHTRPASCVAYSWAGCTAAAADTGPPWLVSGSEDRKIIIWRLQHGHDMADTDAAPGSQGHVQEEGTDNGQSSRTVQGDVSKVNDDRPVGFGEQAATMRHVATAIKHTRKVNCIAAGRHQSQQLLFVGDTSKCLAVYQLPQLT